MAFRILDFKFYKKIDKPIQALIKAIKEVVEILIPIIKICYRSTLSFILKCKQLRWNYQNFEKYLTNLSLRQKKSKKNI